jgi:hypothetical protein
LLGVKGAAARLDFEAFPQLVGRADELPGPGFTGLRNRRPDGGYGTRIQYSVFVCDLSGQEAVLLRGDIEALMPGLLSMSRC